MDDSFDVNLSTLSTNSKETKENSFCSSGNNSVFSCVNFLSKEKKQKILSSILANLIQVIRDNEDSLDRCEKSVIIKEYGECEDYKGVNRPRSYSTPCIFKRKNDIFTLEKPLKIPLNVYIQNILSKTNMEIASFIAAIIYIDQYCEAYKYFLTSNNVHRILLAACLISVKFNEDIVLFNNLYISKKFGITTEELKALEMTLFVSLDYNLYIAEEDYLKYVEYFLGNEED